MGRQNCKAREVFETAAPASERNSSRHPAASGHSDEASACNTALSASRHHQVQQARISSFQAKTYLRRGVFFVLLGAALVVLAAAFRAAFTGCRAVRETDLGSIGIDTMM